MLMQEQGTKMYVDAVLKTHSRVVQVSLLSPEHVVSVLLELTAEVPSPSLFLAEQSERHSVSSLHGGSVKESAGGSSALCEGGELACLLFLHSIVNQVWLIYGCWSVEKLLSVAYCMCSHLKTMHMNLLGSSQLGRT